MQTIAIEKNVYYHYKKIFHNIYFNEERKMKQETHLLKKENIFRRKKTIAFSICTHELKCNTVFHHYLKCNYIK